MLDFSSNRLERNGRMTNLILWILVGLVAGYLAGKVMTGRGMGLIIDIVVGILGALLGSYLAGQVGIIVPGLIGEILVAFYGGRDSSPDPAPGRPRQAILAEARADSHAPPLKGRLRRVRPAVREREIWPSRGVDVVPSRRSDLMPRSG